MACVLQRDRILFIGLGFDRLVRCTRKNLSSIASIFHVLYVFLHETALVEKQSKFVDEPIVQGSFDASKRNARNEHK